MILAVVLAVVLALSAAPALAHEGEDEAELLVEPSSVTAGDTVVLAASGLEPDSDRVLVLAGGHLVVSFETVRTDAEGMFRTELTIPVHLPSGGYEFRAIGDETLTVPLAVTALAGGAEANRAPTEADETIVARERSALELGLILALMALSAAVGGLLVWRAERFRGAFGA